MASHLGEEMDTETEISGDIRNLLTREGSVNAYGFHLGEMKDDGATRSETREIQVLCFAYIFQISSKMFFVLCNSNTGH